METTLFDPSVNPDIFAAGYLNYVQIPIFPAYPQPPFNLNTEIYAPIPNLSVIVPPPDLRPDGSNPDPIGAFLSTNGLPFDGIPGFEALDVLNAGGDFSQLTPSSFFEADANTGYAGFTNYTLDVDNLDLENLDFSDLANIDELLAFELVNPDFPALDATKGVTIAFDLTLFRESSAPDRAGFSLIAVANDPSKAIEIGFKTEGNDRVVALAENFGAAEDSSATALNFLQQQTFWLNLEGDRYSLSSNGVPILSGPLRDYDFDPQNSQPPLPASANPYELPNFLFWGDNTDQANATFALGEISILPLQIPLTDDLLDDYIASYPDLIRAFGYDLAAAKAHYQQFGFAENRVVDRFTEDIYLASHADLIRTFGYQPDAATRHYIDFGFAEGRSTKRFIPEIYLDSYGDLQAAFGDDLQAATRHYIEFGFDEGRDPFAAFDGGAYIASYDDLIRVYGYDPAAGLQHYLQYGHAEGRQITFEADDYIASHGDLIREFGDNLEAGIEHFIRFGASEQRSRDAFDEVAYLNKYADLQREFGRDVEAATRHFILYGFDEGRTV